MDQRSISSFIDHIENPLHSTFVYPRWQRDLNSSFILLNTTVNKSLWRRIAMPTADVTRRNHNTMSLLKRKASPFNGPPIQRRLIDGGN